jgi:hypothetical protein
MNCFQWWRTVAVLGAAIAVGSFGLPYQNSSPADDEKDRATQEDNALAKERLALMQKRMAAAKVSSDQEGFPEKFFEKPIFPAWLPTAARSKSSGPLILLKHEAAG